MEIERKFKIKAIPENLSQYEKKEIRQGYLCTGPVVRIRQCNDEYILTYKNKKGLKQQDAIVSEEVELALTKEAFEHLLEKTDGYTIEKTRYLIPLSKECTAELDVFHGRLDGLVFVEVEFMNENKAKEFIAPDWFGEDVSFDPRYRNTNLSRIDKFCKF